MRKYLLLICFIVACYVKGLSQNVIKEKKTDSLSQAKIYLKQAKTYYKSDDFSNALIYYQLALKESEIAKDSTSMYWSLFQIGVIHFKNNNLSSSENYFNRTLELVKKIHKPLAVVDCYIGLSSVAAERKEYSKAHNYLNKALEITKSVNDSARMSLCINNIGSLYTDMKDFKMAKYYSEQALAYAEKKKDTKNIVIGLVNVGSSCIRLNQNDKAINFFNRALKLSEQIGSPDIKQQIYEALSNAYSASKNYEKSLYYYQLRSNLKDSVFNLTTSEKLAQLESKYQFEKKQKEIIQLKSDNQKSEILLSESEIKLSKRTFLLGFIAVILILILFFVYLFFRQYKEKEKINTDLTIKNKEISEQKKQIESNLIYTQKLQIALKHDLNHYMQLALSKQMNPHFIFNSLNSIQSYILQNDRLSANLYLSKFADLMRKVLENSQHELVTIKEELNTLELYIELEQKRFENKFEFQLQINDDINTNYFLIPPLILQPYFENAIWHGLMHKEGVGILKLVVNRNNENILFSISDNGIGRDAAAKRKSLENTLHESLGTKITSKRLELFSSLNKTDIAVDYTDLMDKKNEASGTLVTITIPIMSAFKNQKNN